ncbi:MAG: hypothetical protein ACK502_09400 [Alphaproteobacteria bacterium]
MLAWIKQNPTLAAGIGLPLVLIVLFSLASAIPAMFVEAPKHDVLFYSQSYSSKPMADVTLSVANGKLKAQYKKRADQYSSNTQNLYLYSAKTGTVKQINVTPPDAGTANWQDFQIPEVSNLKLDTNLTAPDGYTFEAYRSNRGGDIGSLFFMGSYRSNGPIISKDGRSIPLNPATNDYYGYNAQFLGWVNE